MTPTLRNENDDRPRLEYYPLSSEVLRTVVVESYPFTIGRGDETHLKINSTSVSREHARLTKAPEGYLLQDLESTNGTEVNGEPIGQIVLEDGDTLRIAETEITFRCPTAKANGIERLITQPLAGKKKSDTKSNKPGLVAAHRALNEALLWQTIPLCRSRIVEHRSQTAAATLVGAGDSVARLLHAAVTKSDSSTAYRVQQLAWMTAARHAAAIAKNETLFLRFDLQSAIDQRLTGAFESAKACLPMGHELGVLLTWDWAVQSPATINACADLKSLGASLAFDSFTGGATCIDNMATAPPDLLVLAPAIARNISTNPRRKKHLEKTLTHCNDLDIRVVLPAGLEENDRRDVLELGIELVVHEIESAQCTSREEPQAVTV